MATALGYAKPENAISSHVSEEDKTSTLIQGSGSNYKSKTILINESGLYSLIFGSKLESAKKFKRWVTSEILPTIRKTGGYVEEDDTLKQGIIDKLIRQITVSGLNTLIEETNAMTRRLDNEYEIQRSENMTLEIPNRGLTMKLIL